MTKPNATAAKTLPATVMALIDVYFRGEMHTIALEVPFRRNSRDQWWQGELVFKATGLPGRYAGFAYADVKAVLAAVGL